MPDDKSMNASVPDLSWLLRMNEEDMKLLKARYAELIDFIFLQLYKQVVKMEMLRSDDDMQEQLVEQIVDEMARDKLLSPALLKELRAEKRNKHV